MARPRSSTGRAWIASEESVSIPSRSLLDCLASDVRHEPLPRLRFRPSWKKIMSMIFALG